MARIIGGGDMKKSVRFVDKHPILAVLIEVLILMVTFIIFLSFEMDFAVAFMPLNSMTCSIAILRIFIGKHGSYVFAMTDLLWRTLSLEGEEDRYEEVSLEHASIAFWLSIALLLAELIILAAKLLHMLL